MNAFEKILLALLGTASQEAPIFVHSPQGMLILNASELLLANILTSFAPKPVAAVAAPVPAVPAVVPAAATTTATASVTMAPPPAAPTASFVVNPSTGAVQPASTGISIPA